MLVNGSQAKFLFNAAREGHWAIGAFNIMDYIPAKLLSAQPRNWMFRYVFSLWTDTIRRLRKEAE